MSLDLNRYSSTIDNSRELVLHSQNDVSFDLAQRYRSMPQLDDIAIGDKPALAHTVERVYAEFGLPLRP